MTCLWLNNPPRSSLGKNISRLPSLPIQSPGLVLWAPSTYPRGMPSVSTRNQNCQAACYTTYIIRIDAPINNRCLNICMILCGHAPHVHAQTFNLISGYTKIPGKNEIFEPRNTFTCCWVCTQFQELQRRLFLMLVGEGYDTRWRNDCVLFCVIEKIVNSTKNTPILRFPHHRDTSCYHGL